MDAESGCGHISTWLVEVRRWSKRMLLGWGRDLKEGWRRDLLQTLVCRRGGWEERWDGLEAGLLQLDKGKGRDGGGEAE